MLPAQERGIKSRVAAFLVAMLETLRPPNLPRSQKSRELLEHRENVLDALLCRKDVTTTCTGLDFQIQSRLPFVKRAISLPPDLGVDVKRRVRVNHDIIQCMVSCGANIQAV